jgi:hypothetical protein
MVLKIITDHLLTEKMLFENPLYQSQYRALLPRHTRYQSACYRCTHRKYRFEYVTINEYPSRASLNAFPHGKIMGKIAQVRAGFRAELRQPARDYTIFPAKNAKERYDMNLEN